MIFTTKLFNETSQCLSLECNFQNLGSFSEKSETEAIRDVSRCLDSLSSSECIQC